MSWTRIKPKIITLSFYCITLSIFCQGFFVNSASATAKTTEISSTSPIANSTTSNATRDDVTNNFYFQDFSVDYYLSKEEDGSSRLHVIEKFVAIFPNSNQNHGITRIIPYTNQDGKNLTLPDDSMLDIKIKHNGISEKPYKLTPGDGYFTVYIGDPNAYVHGRQVYELEYDFINVITSPSDNPDHQELYWDTNGNDWPQRFDHLTARVHLVGEEVKSAFDGQVACYTGKYGYQNSADCQISQLSDSVEFRVNDLGPYENLTFDLEFTGHTFTLPAPTYDYRLLITVIIEGIIGTILIIIILLIHFQTKTKRDFYHGLFLTPEYIPPADFTVAEMATNYVGQTLLGSNKVATLMELAVNHKVELHKVGTERKPQWIVKLLSLNLNPEQIDVLKILAGHDSTLKVGQEILIKKHFADRTLTRLHQKYDRHILESLRTHGLFETKATQKNQKSSKNPFNPCDILFAGGVLWVIISIATLPFLFEDIPSYITLFGGGWLIAAIILLAIIIALTAFLSSNYYQKFYTHTEAGLKWSRYLDGLKLYIKMAEQDRIKFLQSVKNVDTSHQGIANLYEKLLPYAIIFRLETSWLKEMGKYYEMEDVSSPIWYFGATTFSTHEFTNAMHSLSAAAIASDLASHSSTSGSSSGLSGSSGGGFSGGGGGGGGGGGW